MRDSNESDSEHESKQDGTEYELLEEPDESTELKKKRELKPKGKGYLLEAGIGYLTGTLVLGRREW
jgi:hypothetical protein